MIASILLKYIPIVFSFIDNSDTLSSIASTIASATLAGLFYFYVFKKPKLELMHSEEIEDSGKRKLKFHIFNHKKYMRYETDDIFCNIYIPKSFFREDYKYEIHTSDLWKEIPDVFKRLRSIEIDGVEYFIFGHNNKSDLFPKITTALLCIMGNFPQGTYKIYYLFNTPYGRCPASTNPEQLVKGKHSHSLTYKVTATQTPSSNPTHPASLPLPQQS